MRRLTRPGLSKRSVGYLKSWSAQIAAAADPREASERLWPDKRRTKTIEEIRDTLKEMNGLVPQVCMYCEYNEAGHIDHFEPRSREPGRTFDWLNHLLACDVCNSNYKRELFERHDGVLPVDPTSEDPREHLRFLPSGKCEALTPRGAWSIRVFGLDRPWLEQQRRNRWFSVREHLVRYAELKRSERHLEAEQIRLTLTTTPCASIFSLLLDYAVGPKAAILGLAECRAAIEAFPEIKVWIQKPP